MKRLSLIDDNALVLELKKSLSLKLPGTKAQQKMSPSHRVQSGLDIANAKESGVLIALYKNNNQWHIPLIQRPVYKGVHSGQISLPGGKFEPFDKNIKDTALREANEEVGINKSDFEVLGSLSKLYIPHSNFMVHPYIAFSEKPQNFKPDLIEVDEIIEIPLMELYSTENIKNKTEILNGVEVDIPYYNYNNKTIWGATAMILSEFGEVIKSIVK